jgi:hypothetical protein
MDKSLWEDENTDNWFRSDFLENRIKTKIKFTQVVSNRCGNRGNT